MPFLIFALTPKADIDLPGGVPLIRQTTHSSGPRSVLGLGLVSNDQIANAERGFAQGVANHGIIEAEWEIVSATSAEWRNTVDVDLYGAFRAAEEAQRELRRQHLDGPSTRQTLLALGFDPDAATRREQLKQLFWKLKEIEDRILEGPTS